jgi:hypothetical protein
MTTSQVPTRLSAPISIHHRLAKMRRSLNRKGRTGRSSPDSSKPRGHSSDWLR